MTKKTDTPAIRFKGFSDTWEQRKVTEIGKIYIGLVTTMTKHYTDEGTLLIRNSDIKDGKFEFGDNPIYLEKTFAEKNETRMHQIGDVITVHTGDVGTSAVITENEAKSIGFATIVTRPNPKIIDSNYLCSFLNTDKHKKWAVSISTGDGRTNYNLGDYFELVVPVPSIAEQKKIASYIQKLNRLITLHQRKYEKLHNIKKSMLEKMFPKNGSNVPEIRFKGFTEAWEQRKFSELYEKVSRKNDLTYGKDDIISVANMYFKADSYITDESYLLTYNIFELGDIAFEGNKSKNYAHGRFVENTIGNGIVSHVFDVFKPIMKPYDLQFWKYAINNEQLMGGILLRSTKASTMMTNLVANDFLQETFLVPAYPEQQKIGAFFQELDRLITLHQRELEKLQNIKKSMLEKMFV